MEVATATAETILRVFTACPADTRTLLLDVRPNKDFKKKHVLLAYSIRLAANGKTLLDYSKATYDFTWSQDCWWDKHVVVYGGSDLTKAHPVVSFLAKEKRARSLAIFKPGFDALDTAFPFICSPSTKANSGKRYPSIILPGLLYLGDWDAAQDLLRLDELNIRRIITIHNNPENLKPPDRYQHLKIEMPDIDVADITAHFGSTYNFIEEGRVAGHATLVHCGAGVSRSACLCIAYLMRSRRWSAQAALDHCKARRSLIQPNDGFWQRLCALEAPLGITDRSDPTATTGFHGDDAPVVVAGDAAGEKVAVLFVPSHKNQLGGPTPGGTAPLAAAPPPGSTDATRRQRSQADRGERDSMQARKHRSQEREGGRDRDRDRDGDRDRHRDGDRDNPKRHRSPSPDRDRHRDRGTNRDRDRDKGRHKSRSPSRRDRDGRDGAEDKHRHKLGRPAEPDRADPGTRAQGVSEVEPEARPAEGTSSAAAPPSVDQPVGVTLRVLREGKDMGELQLAMTSGGQQATFGRAPGCEVVLEHASISRRHANLALDHGLVLTVTDLASGHGTNVDGLWLRPNAPKVLSVGSTVLFGGSTRTYKVVSAPRLRR